ncbi:hypothetical protein M513_01651 [Trichuris suis]|uniref:Peptidase S1 domain-containing protein n=1 Tax=Trichuris suis TaxID=68888 RepID=A0A085MK02_9BILA|nr:hypothetical protein M513_01651 [Trichuris suis]
MLFQAEMFYENRYSLLIVISLEFLLFQSSEEICGQPYYKPFIPSSRLSNRITNGVEVRKHSHPWQALVHKKFDHGHLGICGGSLIHWKESNASDLVLTAAHCVFNGDTSEQATPWKMITNVFSSVFGGHESKLITNVTDVLVYLGVHDTELFDSKVKRFRVAAMAIGDFDAKSKAHDIALLKLENKATYNEFIQGVCLPTQDENLPDAPRYCMVAGWGLLDDGTLGTKLQQVKAYIYEDVVYQSTFHKSRMICTDSSKRKAGAREGDSGSPLTCAKNGTFYIYGIMSFQFREPYCMKVDKEAFVKVAHYVKWMKKVVAKLHEKKNISAPSASRQDNGTEENSQLTNNGSAASVCAIKPFQYLKSAPKLLFRVEMFYENTCALLIVISLECLLFHGTEEICGQPHYKPILPTNDTVGNRIANGIEARRHSHPWQALVYKLVGEEQRICGGSLIHWQEQNASDLVLTAAHCVLHGYDSNGTTPWQIVTYAFTKIFNGQESKLITNVTDVEVYLGMHSITRVSSYAKRYRVAAMMVGEFNKINKPHDIAVLKLDSKATYNRFIQGICLPTEDENLPALSSQCLVVGWGLLGEQQLIYDGLLLIKFFDIRDNFLADGRLSKRLQQVSANVYEDIIRNSMFNKHRMICTDSAKTGAGARHGDSGGPLACLKNDTFVIYGVMSFQFREPCSDKMDKQAFVKVSHYIKWLSKVISTLNEKNNAEARNINRNAYSDMRKVLLLIICANLLCRDSEEFCGQPVVKPILSTKDQAANRISNGIEVRMHSHPWQALILIKDLAADMLCGGSLMHWNHENASEFILTAAHCLVNWVRYRKERTAQEKTEGPSLSKRYESYPLVNVSDVIVYLGLHDIKQPTSAMKKLRITAMAVAQFDVYNRTDDIALLKLEKEITYSAEIQGICLPTKDEVLPPESLCLVAGWGRLRDGERGTKLQQFQTHIIIGKVNNSHYQEDLMICTGSKTRNTGARKGDSGGPLVCLRNNTFVVYGVLSFGFTGKCSGATDGQVFTKVAKYLPWLQNKVEELSLRA